MHGYSVWSVAYKHGEGYTKQTIDLLKILQAKTGRIIGGIYKATSGPALDIELYLLPVEHQIWKTSAGAVSRILSSDKCQPWQASNSLGLEGADRERNYT